jgi:hypothetical protein
MINAYTAQSTRSNPLYIPLSPHRFAITAKIHARYINVFRNTSHFVEAQYFSQFTTYPTDRDEQTTLLALAKAAFMGST